MVSAHVASELLATAGDVHAAVRFGVAGAYASFGHLPISSFSAFGENFRPQASK